MDDNRQDYLANQILRRLLHTEKQQEDEPFQKIHLSETGKDKSKDISVPVLSVANSNEKEEWNHFIRYQKEYLASKLIQKSLPVTPPEPIPKLRPPEDLVEFIKNRAKKKED
ncbi:MAG: hypothetical protein ACI86H_000264 [bacterium]|jgi:hypothetical protein